MIERLLVRLGLTTPLAILVILMGIAGVFGTSVAEAHPLPGSIKTTDLDGNAVQQNHFIGKCSVALNGGAQQPRAHHLPDGFYDVAVTNPNSRSLLGVGEGTVEVSNGEGTFGPVSLCNLVGGTYNTTPHNGGVYKVAVCQPDHLRVISGQLEIDRHGCKFSTFKVVEPDAPPVQPPGLGPPVSKPPQGEPPTGGPLLPPGIVGPPEAKIPGPSPTPIQLVPTKLPESGATANQTEFWFPGVVIALAALGFTAVALSGGGYFFMVRPSR